mgnify:CR=1 FL=1
MKNIKPLVSVIMNCCNGEKYLRKSIQSLIKQSYSNWELIFWDNKSTDKSKQIFMKFKDKKVKYFYSSKYNTLYKSRNLAINKAKGKFITFLDTDDLWKKNKIKEQIKFMLKNKLKICYSNYTILNKKNRKDRIVNKQYNLNVSTQQLLNYYDLGILTSMVEFSIFKKKKFNTKFEIIGDFDLFIRLSLSYKIGYLNKSLAFYRVHNSNLSLIKNNLHINELKDWIKKNSNSFKRKNLDLKKQKQYLLKLQVKRYLKY